MFNKYRSSQYKIYNKARDHFVGNFDQLINLEKYLSDYLCETIEKNLSEIAADYNETNYLFPFWQNYPPDDRGRMPKGDQIPWLEVGEHVVGCKIARFLGNDFEVRDTGLPTGPDQRFLIKSHSIAQITNNYTNSCWLFIDIKSVGPRDDQNHTVMSHNQISGNGKWFVESRGIQNSVIQAVGQRASHPFYCSIPPIYVLGNGTIAPVVIVVIKPVYRMLTIENNGGQMGQPLGRITFVTIPNGLLLEEHPNYLASYPNLFFPGKDDKQKNPLKIRCRVSFSILRSIAEWRVRDIIVD